MSRMEYFDEEDLIEEDVLDNVDEEEGLSIEGRINYVLGAP